MDIVLPEPSSSHLNGARLSRLIVDGGGTVLRKHFNRLILPENLQEKLRKNKKLLKTLYKGKQKILKPSQWNLLFPSSGEASSENFDITLLFLLLRNICGLPPPLRGWDFEPANTDSSLQANIIRLKTYKNKIVSHVATTAVSDADFTKLWSDFSRLLIQLGANKDSIERLKSDPLDASTEREYTGILKDMYDIEKRVNADYAELLSKQDTLLRQEENVLKLLMDLGKLREDKKTAPKLPQRVQNFVGRDDIQSEILKHMHSPARCVVNILGPPGIGKTSIATEVAYSLSVPVYYITLRDATSPYSIPSLLLSKLGYPRQSGNFAQDLLLRWIGHLQEPIVIIMDNIQDMLIHKKSNQFYELLREFYDASEMVNFLFTSQQSFQDSELGHIIEIQVRQMDITDAMKYLYQQLETKINDEKLETLCQLCVCMPMAIKIVSAMINDPTLNITADDMIQSLSSNQSRLKQLRYDSWEYGKRTVEESIRKSYRRLSPKEKEVAMCLAVFPASFEITACMSVLNVENAGECKTFLLPLCQRSFLEYDKKVDRYSFHPFIAEYFLQCVTDSQLLKKYQEASGFTSILDSIHHDSDVFSFNHVFHLELT